MPKFDLKKYGLPLAIDLTGEWVEYPATAANPLNALLVFLVDENHSSVNEPAVRANAADVARIVDVLPDTVVVLEHFLVGSVVNEATPRKHGGSRFHIFLQQITAANTIGGDDQTSLQTFSDITDDYEVKVFDEPDETDKVRLTEEGRLKVREHPKQLTRSRSLVSTLLKELAAKKQRVGVINAGANHNTHVLDNPMHNGQPVCADRSRVSFVRLRPVEELRRVAAYLNWIARGRPLWEESVDWEMATKLIPRLT